MSEPKYREWILETIDSLRSRKARPDLERICRMVRRRHGSDPDRTRTELEKLIQQQTVLKVSYKGSISYRNAAKVQRKSRKKIEFAPACSTSAEESRERTNHNILNNGDSAHSFTDQEEDSEPSLDQQPQTPTSTTENTNRQSSSPRSGIVCLSCGATTGCAVGSGCQRENASASKDPGLGQHLRAGCLSPSHDHGINARGFDTDTKIPPNVNRKERGLCSAKVGSGEAADTKNETCPVDVRATAHDATSIEKQKSPVALKPPVRKSDLGDRLVSSVRSLSERNLRACSAPRGQIKPLGLREILGYLSGQERLSEEKFTRGKVKGVLEREIARGRLRRTRCGNITLPLRGLMVVAAEEPISKNMTTDRLLDGVAQGRNIVETEKETVEAGCGEEEEEGEEEQDDLQSAEKEEEVITKPGLEDDAEIQTPSESPQHLQQYCGVSVQDSLPRTRSLPAGDGLPSHTTSTQSGDSSATTKTLQRDAHDLSPPPPIPCLDQVEMQCHASPILNNVVCRGEAGMHPDVSEEQGMNGGFNDRVQLKSKGVGVSPVDWTVSDVANYFAAVGFPEQAVAFKAQEIDGRSLLLMQRNDVLTGLSIRLGPAVKIYERHVKALQKTHFEDDDC